MNELLFIDPECVNREDLQWFQAAAGRLGFQSGLFCARIPGDWMACVRSYGNEPGRGERGRKICLEVAKRAREEWLLPCIGESEEQRMQSVANAVVQERGSIGIASAKDKGVVVSTLEDAVLGIKEDVFKHRHDANIPTTVESYASAFGPLVVKSAELHLIDPYAFSIGGDVEKKKWNALLLRFSEFARVSATPMKDFFIHVWEEPGVKSEAMWINLRNLEGFFNSELQRAGATFSVSYIRGADVKVDVHDRYLIGPKGGMHLGRGVFLKKETETTVSYLSHDTFLENHNKWVAPVHEQCSWRCA